MSWQERIERYKQEIGDTKRVEQDQFLKIREEYLQSALRTAEDLSLRQLLGEIRDQVWRLGKVSYLIVTDPSNRSKEIPSYLPYCDPYDPKVGLVAFFLKAEWPCYSGGFYTTIDTDYGGKEEWIDSPQESVHREELCIACLSRPKVNFVPIYSNGIRIIGSPPKLTSKEETRQWIEESLVRYYAQPSWVITETPYDKKARKDLEELEKWKKRQPPR